MNSALTVQGRVIYALMMREIHTVHGKSRLGYLWALFQVIMQILIFWAIREVTGFKAPGMPTLYFLLAGFSLFYMFTGVVKKTMAAVAGNKPLLTFPQVKPLDFMISRMIVLWATELVSAVLLIFSGQLFGYQFSVSHFGLFLFVICISPMLGLGCGLIAHAFNILFPVTDKIVPIITRFMFFTSGLFFSVSSLPKRVVDYLWWNPMTQIIDIGRLSIAQGYRAIDYSILYICSFTAVTLCLGLLLERHVRRKI